MPWDQRIARWLVTPLINTPISPNVVTTVGLLCGLAACVGFASGEKGWANWAALLYLLAELADHADGELARLADKKSHFGHVYDMAASAIGKILLFVGIGCGLRTGTFGWWAALMGLVAGVSIAAIFVLRLQLAEKAGEGSTKQANFAGFETEDVLYLVAPITWLGWLSPFLVAAVAGAPAFALFTLWQLRKARVGGCR